MLTLKAKIREETGKKVKRLRKKGFLPAILYGPKIPPTTFPKKGTVKRKTQKVVGGVPLEIDQKEFEKIYKEAEESSLISLEVGIKKFLVLIHEIKKDPLSGKIIHVDFYQPILTEEVEVTVPLVFEGTSPAVKGLGGTLVKEISEVVVKALPHNLPHEIKVNVEILKTFEDEILIKDLKVPVDVKIQREPEEIVAVVTRPEKVEEELEKPIEEKVEEVEKVEEPASAKATAGEEEKNGKS